MHVLIRTDASAQWGTGHVMRCIVLAELLLREGFQVVFACQQLEGNMINFLRRKGFHTISLPTLQPFDQVMDACNTKHALSEYDTNQWDWIVVDHYFIDKQWHAMLRQHTKAIMVLDDLADREHDCDLLLDQNAVTSENKYRGLVPKRCRILLGLQYLLIKQEFTFARKKKKEQTMLGGISEKTGIKRILVFFGGSDPTGETGKALSALQQMDLQDIKIAVVTGSTNPEADQIDRICQKNGYTHFHQIDHMADVMAQADLALGAGGVSMWERCYVGLPSIIIIVAENQKKMVEDLHANGIVWTLGWHSTVTSQDIADILHKAISSPYDLQAMSKKARMLFSEHVDDDQTHPVVDLMKEVD